MSVSPTEPVLPASSRHHRRHATCGTTTGQSDGSGPQVSSVGYHPRPAHGTRVGPPRTMKTLFAGGAWYKWHRFIQLLAVTVSSAVPSSRLLIRRPTVQSQPTRLGIVISILALVQPALASYGRTSQDRVNRHRCRAGLEAEAPGLGCGLLGLPLQSLYRCRAHLWPPRPRRRVFGVRRNCSHLGYDGPSPRIKSRRTGSPKRRCRPRPSH